MFRYFFTLTVTYFLVLDKSVGKEFEQKFKYHINYKSYDKRSNLPIIYNDYWFKGDLTIKGDLDNWLECQLENVNGSGVEYLNDMRQKFKVKLNNRKIVDFKTIGVSSHKASKKKREMIEQIMIDTNWTAFIKKGYYKIDMPIGGKCEANLTEENINNKKIYKATIANNLLCRTAPYERSSLKSKPFRKDFMTEYLSMITLSYDTEIYGTTKLSLIDVIKFYNWNDNIYESKKIILIEPVEVVKFLELKAAN